MFHAIIKLSIRLNISVNGIKTADDGEVCNWRVLSKLRKLRKIHKCGEMSILVK